MADQFYFGNEMQDLLLACWSKYYAEFTIVGPLVKPEYMWGMSAMRVTGAMQEYFKENHKYPTFSALRGYLSEKMSRDKADLLVETMEYISGLQKIDTSDWQWVKQVVTKFCRERALIVAVKKAADMIKSDKVPEGGFSPMFDDAMAVGRDFSDLGILFTEDYKKVIEEATRKSWGIKTGFQKLDAIWRNGWGPGWLIVPLAPPKSYKSTFCINLALKISRKGTNEDSAPVFYYACEISAELTALRGYAIVSDIELDKMYDHPEQFIEATGKGLGVWFGTADNDREQNGLILLKSYPLKTATIADIRSHALAAIEAYGVRPKVIVIDHAETVKVSQNSRDSKASDHRAQADIYAEARALGQELKCAVIMPDRCNKETVQFAVPNMTSFQGSFEKAGVVDVAIGLCQTEQERLKHVMRYFIFMNRHGKQFGYFQGTIGENQFSMTIDEPLDYADAIAKYEAAQKENNQRKGKRGGGVNFRMPANQADM